MFGWSLVTLIIKVLVSKCNMYVNWQCNVYFAFICYLNQCRASNGDHYSNKSKTYFCANQLGQKY